MRNVATFNIECVGFIDADGRAEGPLPDFASDHALLCELYRAMVLTRTFDARAVALQRTGRLGTFASSLGQEAVAVGMAAAMRAQDVLLPSFREQGAQFLRGVSMLELLLYWGGDERGNDFRSARGDFPICVPVGSQVPHAAGVALAFKLRNEARVAVCSFGDGATSKGDVYEAMNFAGVQALPVVFVVNNNQWAISVPRERQSAARTLAQKAIACGFYGQQVDGNDVLSMRHVMGEAVERARDGAGPTLIEALSYRLSDHTTADDASRYRDDAEVSRRWKDEPVARMRNFLTALGCWSKDDEDNLITDCAAQVESATTAYLATTAQAPRSMFDHLHAHLPDAYADQRAALIDADEGGAGMSEHTLLDAVRLALARAMQDDDTVLLLGEDVGVNGGVFRATEGLQQRFGANRVLDTPLSEALLTGLAVGLGAQGLRPVVEFQFMGFMYPAIDQLANHAGRLRNRTRGRLSCPIVLRAPFGGGIHAPEHHSESFEAMLAHIPGIRVVIPSSPRRAYGLLLAAIRDPDPVVFLEPKRLYRALEEQVDDDAQALPLDRCATLRPGVDITLVSWGAMLHETIACADALAARGIDAEVIDVSTLRPLDMTTIVDSVRRTGRCVIVQEAPKSCGFGAEVAAGLADEGLTALLAPVRRVAGYDTVMPLSRLEAHYMPSVARILDAAVDVLDYT